MFGDSSDDESLPSKRQKLSDGEDSDDDVPFSAVTLPSERQKLSDGEDSDDDVLLSAVTKKDSGEFMGLVSHMFILK